jgi:hypothetical protein
MKLSWDEAKRQRTLAERGLDFAEAEKVFAGPTFEFPDDRHDYGEHRIVCVGFLNERMVAIVYVQNRGGRRIISMRKTNDREQKIYKAQIGRSR